MLSTFDFVVIQDIGGGGGGFGALVTLFQILLILLRFFFNHMTVYTEVLY